MEPRLVTDLLCLATLAILAGIFVPAVSDWFLVPWLLSDLGL